MITTFKIIDVHDTTVPMTTLLAELGTWVWRFRPPVPQGRVGGFIDPVQQVDDRE